VQSIHGLQGDGTVDAAIVGYVRFLGWSNERIQNIVNFHRDHIGCAVVQKLGEIETETRISAHVLAGMVTIDLSAGDLKNAPELEPQSALGLPLRHHE